MKILENLPEEVKEVFFSQKTADNIDNICKKYGVPSEKISEVANYVGMVLLGILSLDKFSGTLKDNVKLKNGAAENIAQEIEMSIFHQVEYGLRRTAPLAEKPAEFGKTPPDEKELKKPGGKDIYREPVV